MVSALRVIRSLLRSRSRLGLLTSGLVVLCSLYVVLPLFTLYKLKLYYSSAYILNRHQCDLVPEENIKGQGQHYRVWATDFGRLGNVMFITASAYGIGKSLNRKFIVTPGLHYSLASTFNLDLEGSPSIPMCPIPENATKLTVPFGSYAMEYFNAFANTADIQVCCFLQSWKYFEEHKREIRQLFSLHSTYSEQAQSFLRRVRTTPEQTFVGVHVRHGDITHIDGYKTATTSYLRKAMLYYVKRYSNVHFIVCSDDPAWTRSQPVFSTGRHLDYNYEHHVTFCPSFSTESHDLALLSACNHSVMTVGTFGWWAAWLAEGEVVYFDEPYDKETKLGRRFSSDNYFPTHWIPMGD